MRGPWLFRAFHEGAPGFCGFPPLRQRKVARGGAQDLGYSGFETALRGPQLSAREQPGLAPIPSGRGSGSPRAPEAVRSAQNRLRGREAGCQCRLSRGARLASPREGGIEPKGQRRGNAGGEPTCAVVHFSTVCHRKLHNSCVLCRRGSEASLELWGAASSRGPKVTGLQYLSQG